MRKKHRLQNSDGKGKTNTCEDKINQSDRGFSLTELLVAVTIIGTISSIAIPAQLKHLCKTETNEATAVIGSIKAIISAYVDETGTYPSTWDDLSSISTVMSENGAASGELSTAITLPSKDYEVKVSGPTNSIFSITANRKNGCKHRDIKACLNLSNGASELKTGNGTTVAAEANCN